MLSYLQKTTRLLFASLYNKLFLLLTHTATTVSLQVFLISTNPPAYLTNPLRTNTIAIMCCPLSPKIIHIFRFSIPKIIIPATTVIETRRPEDGVRSIVNFAAPPTATCFASWACMVTGPAGNNQEVSGDQVAAVLTKIVAFAVFAHQGSERKPKSPRRLVVTILRQWQSGHLITEHHRRSIGEGFWLQRADKSSVMSMRVPTNDSHTRKSGFGLMERRGRGR